MKRITSIFLLLYFLLIPTHITQAKEFYSQQTLSTIDELLNDPEQWKYNEIILESLNQLSGLIGYHVPLSYNSVKPNGFVSEYDDLVKHIKHKRQYTYSIISESFGTKRIHTIYNLLNKLSEPDHYEIFFESYTILVKQMCLPEAESDLELLLEKGDIKTQIGSALILGEACNSKSISTLKKILIHSNTVSINLKAASYLLTMDVDEGRDYIQDASLNVDNQLIQSNALRNLTWRGNKDDIDFVIENLTNDLVLETNISSCFRNICNQSPRLSIKQKDKLLNFFEQKKHTIFQNPNSYSDFIIGIYQLNSENTADKIFEFLLQKEIQQKDAVSVISSLGFLKAKDYLPYIIPFLNCNDEAIRNYTLFSTENMLSEQGTITKQEFTELYPDLEEFRKERLDWWEINKDNYSSEINEDNLIIIQSIVENLCNHE